MTINDKFKDEKLQYDFNREAAKISALSLGKTDKYEYLTGEEILLSDQSRIIDLAKFTNFPLGKAFKKKTIKEEKINNKALNNKDNYEEIFNELVKERFVQIIELTDEIKPKWFNILF